jgi:ubiquitin C-terminal hydrolase
MRAYFEKEQVEWMGKQVFKWYEIKEYPTLLWITLKRFDNRNQKNNSFVQIPMEMDGYELISICNHFGNTRGGHYTATVKKDQWYECNDELIKPAHPNTNHAYCLLFRKKTM